MIAARNIAKVRRLEALRHVGASLQRGMTLIELMVSIVIGLGLTLAITSLLISSENHKRTTTSTNDAEQTGAYAFYALDRALRSAGSAIAESAYPVDHGVLGCRLNAQANGTTILPRPSAFPAPFAGLLGGTSSALRVAPLLIAKNQSPVGGSMQSDILVVFGASGAAGGVSRQVTGGGTANTLVLDNTVSFAKSDLALVSQNGITDCLLEQVAPTFTPPTPTLTFAGIYYTTGNPTSLATFAASTSSYVTPIGNAAPNAAASNVAYQLFGVDANRTLWSYDLLQNQRYVLNSGADTSQAIAEGVDQLHAIYGVDTDFNGTQDAWAAPDDTGYTIASVVGNVNNIIKTIVAVRVALVMRGDYYDTNYNSPTSLVFFSGLKNGAGASLQQTFHPASDQLHYRYRIFEFTIPLRNALLLNSAPTAP